MEFPAPFGRELSKEEAYIAEMDAKTGASLKLTVLNGSGRILTLVAGGGASVVYADAIASAGFADDLANYGEYSGAPTESQTYYYARTVLDLMLRAPISPKGKVLFIGGGIANFTNVASTFKGVIRALREYAKQLNEHNVQILGTTCWPKLARRPEEHEGCHPGTRPQCSCLRPRYARVGYCPSSTHPRSMGAKHSSGVPGLSVVF